jgi:hypothetical protein
MKQILTFFILLFSASVHAVEVESIEVKLFYEESGIFSEDILSAKDFSLWNTIIGEGSASEPSDRFLVRVKIIGPKENYVSEKIELKVKSKDGKMVYSETFNGFLFSKQGVVYRASLVAGHNCESLVIEAGKVSKTVDFQCGE